MKNRMWFVAALCALFAFGALADEKTAAKKEMSAEEKAMMEQWQKAMTPGAEHKMLDSMAGTWDAKVTSWMAPGAPPMVSMGTAEQKWIMGNRYLEQTFSGSMMDMPYHGMGHTGYDNVRKQFWSTWMDNMGTGMMVSTGSTADSGKNFTFKGSYADPMTGKEATMDEKLMIVDKNHHNFEMWGPAPDGSMYKMMTIEYTRKK